MNWVLIFLKLPKGTLLKSRLKVVFVNSVYTVFHTVVVLMWIPYSAPVRVRKSTVNPTEYLCYVSLCMHVLCLSIYIMLIAIYELHLEIKSDTTSNERFYMFRK